MRNKTINIIIASHCDYANLRFTLEKLLSYKLNYLCIIIVDSNRDTNTQKYLESISSDIKYISETDNGIASAWNKGIKLMEDGWVMFLGCGDIISKTDLNKLYKNISYYGSSDILYGDTILFSKQNYSIKKSKPFNFNQNKVFPFLHPSVIVPCTLFNEVGNFDESFRYAMDSDFFIRIFLSKKYKFVQCDHSVEMLDDGLSVQNWFSANLEFLRSKKKNFKLSDLTYFVLFVKLFFSYVIIFKLKISSFFKYFKKTVHNLYIKIINLLLSFTPFFFLRYFILRYLLKVKIDSSCSIHNCVSFKTIGNVKIGSNTVINRHVYFDNSNMIEIGRNVSISQHTKLLTLGHDINDSYFKTKGKPIFIDDYCVLFTGSYVLPGTKLHWGSVVYPNVSVNGTYNKSVVLSSSNVVLRKRVQDELKYNLRYKDWFC